MAGLSNYDCEGVLSLNSVSMNRPAWAVVGDDRGAGGLFQLLTTVDIRGNDRTIPGSAGVIPFRRRTTVSRYSFRLIVTGEVDSTGAVNADPVLGLVNNLEYLWDNVIDPPNTTTGTVAASWTPPGAAARTANVHVVRCEVSNYGLADKTLWEGRLVISNPSGRFEI